MASIDDLLQEFPEPVRTTVRRAWDALPPNRRSQVAALLPVLPGGDLKAIRELLAQIMENQTAAFRQDKKHIAIVGPANVGKSTLYNQLIVRQEDRAAVSPVPGTTRTTQVGDAGLFRIADTPGADAAGESGARERGLAFDAARAADFLVILFDASEGIKQEEARLFAELRDLGKPFVVALNKTDLVSRRELPRVVETAARTLGLEPEQVLPIQAINGQDVGRVVLAITKAEPGLLMAVAAALPEYRARLAWQRIIPAATAAASVAFIPLPVADVIPLLGIQTGMVLTIARIYGFDITLARAKELIGTFGLGLAARTAFQELSKLGGVPGWFLSAAIAASTTVVMGYAATIWFARGERPSQEALNRAVTDVTQYLKEQLADLRTHRPGQGTLRQRIGQALEGLPRRLRPGQQPAFLATENADGSELAGAKPA